jgi:hypothetical protein
MIGHTRRFYTTLLFSNAANESEWAGGFFRHPAKPTRAELFDLFKDDAAGGLQRRGYADTIPASVHVANLFELPDPPRPGEDDARPLSAWKVKVDFVCHDIKFGHADEGVFQWPEQPIGGPLEAMARVLMAERLAMRGDGPDYTDYCDVLALEVEPTTEEPDHPLEAIR